MLWKLRQSFSPWTQYWTLLPRKQNKTRQQVVYHPVLQAAQIRVNPAHKVGGRPHTVVALTITTQVAPTGAGTLRDDGQWMIVAVGGTKAATVTPLRTGTPPHHRMVAS